MNSIDILVHAQITASLYSCEPDAWLRMSHCLPETHMQQKMPLENVTVCILRTKLNFKYAGPLLTLCGHPSVGWYDGWARRLACKAAVHIVGRGVDLSPRLGGHTVANQPPTTLLLSFTFILSPLTITRSRNGVRSHNRCGTESLQSLTKCNLALFRFYP